MPDPAPARGYRNCSRCGAWKPVSAFPPGRIRRRDGTPIDPPQPHSQCERCRRQIDARRARLRRRARTLAVARARVAAGEAVWAGPIRAWVARELAAGWTWGELAARAGADHERTFRKQLTEGATVRTDWVDRLLLDANEPFVELYPPDAIGLAA